MAGVAIQPNYKTWTLDNHPWATIECSTAVLDQVQLATVEGLNRVPRGGLEVGGVLFGLHTPGTIRILDARPICCEYATGPSFALSGRDREELKELLATYSTGSDLAGLEPVGWYHSHTRSDISFTASDAAIHDAFFPQPWQIALVVKPANLSPTRIGLFVRDPSGEVRPQNAEFALEPLSKKTPTGEPAAEAPAAEGRATDARAAGAPARKTPAEHAPVADAPAKQRPAEDAETGPELPFLPVRVWRPEPPIFDPSEPAKAANEETVHRKWLLPAALLAGFVLSAAVYLVFTNAMRVSLRVVDMGGQLHIEWSRVALAVRWGQGAELEIKDGSAQTQLELDARDLRTGTVTYERQSTNVLVRMRVHTRAAGVIEETAQFVGPLRVAAPVAAPAPSPAAAIEDAGVLREELQKHASTVSRLEQMVSSIQKGSRSAEPPSRTPPKARAEVEARAANPIGAESQRSRRSIEVPAPSPERERREYKTAPLPPPPAIPVASAANTAPAVSVSMAPKLEAAPPPKLETAAPAKTRPAQEGPSRGRLIWTGRLQKNGILAVDGAHSSDGSVNGELPGVPVRVVVHAAELTPNGMTIFGAPPEHLKSPIEAPGAQNGWNKTWYTRNTQRESDLFVLEAPGPQNDWKRVVVRTRNLKTSLLSIDWFALPSR